MEHYDFIALGGGNAGLSASTRVAAAGRKVALVDPTAIGGLCSLHGCNPKKVLVRATEVLQEVRDAGEHGIATGEPRIDWGAVVARKRWITEPATGNAERWLAENKVDRIRGTPRFVGPDQIEVDGRPLAFDGLVIATGSTPSPLGFPGAELVRTSDDILELQQVPGSLVVIGAGTVAFEFAQVFARAGSSVHVLMRGGQPLRQFDQDLVSRLVDHSRHLGIVFHAGAEVARVELAGDALSVRLADGRTLRADFVLNAAGRIPQVGTLNLEAAGVEYDRHGVTVDDCLRSPGNPRIFAAGDAHGRLMLSPVASYEGRLVADNFLHQAQRKADYRAIPSVVFAVPSLAMVGMTEAEARNAGLEVEVSAQDMSAWTVFSIANAHPAFGKVVSEKGRA
jgi:glutathione reductase (NADPH)